MHGTVQGLKNVARKTARVNPDLIDVDLVRGICQHFLFLCVFVSMFLVSLFCL